jgi:hypothetical protein
MWCGVMWCDVVWCGVMCCDPLISILKTTLVNAQRNQLRNEKFTPLAFFNTRSDM